MLKMSNTNNINPTSYHNETNSAESLKSSGNEQKKNLRRLIVRFAEKTSMTGVPYIKNATVWWSRLIWTMLLLCALGALVLHLWYSFSQYFSYPKTTKISLSFATLAFPEVTICNTNTMHKGRLNSFQGAPELKKLVTGLQPENLVPDQFNQNYDPLATSSPINNFQANTSDKMKQQSSTAIPEQSSQSSHQTSNGAVQNSSQSSTVTPEQSSLSSQQKTKTAAQNSSQSTLAPQSTNRRKRFVKNYDTFNISSIKLDHQNRRESMPIDSNEYNATTDSQTDIEDLFTELFMDINRQSRAMLGHNISDMLLSCSFGGRQCDDNMFKLQQTSKYGNCWTLSSDKFIVGNSGPSGGLTLVLYLEVTEYLEGISNGYGAVLHVHEQNTYSFPADEGSYIPASMETNIGLKLVDITRLGKPWGTCNDGSDFLSKYNHKYTRQSCQSFCQIVSVMDNCGCFDDNAETFAKNRTNDSNPCRSKKEITCMLNIQQKFKKQQLQCSCDNPCSESQYIKSVSQRQWPSDNYAMVLLQGVCDRQKEVCQNLRQNISDRRALSNNFLKINIFYEDLNYEDITEAADIEIQQFLSDIGGAIGLWIGLSILSLCEVIQLFVELCAYCGRKTLKQTRKDKKSQRENRKQLKSINKNYSESTDSLRPNSARGVNSGFVALPDSISNDHSRSIGNDSHYDNINQDHSFTSF